MKRKNQITITENQIEIIAPLYRAYFCTIKDAAILYIPLMCIFGLISLAISKYEDTLKVILFIGLNLYAYVFIFYVLINIYYITSKTKIIINQEEIALYKRDKKKKVIATKDVAKIYYFSNALFSPGQDKCSIYANNKTVILFAVSPQVIDEIEKIIGYTIPYNISNKSQ